MSDEILDPESPHIVLGNFASLRPGDMFLQKNLWVRVVTVAAVAAPAGHNLPDSQTVEYTDAVRRSAMSYGELKSMGFFLRKLTDPGDRSCRIVREVHPGDEVRSFSDPDGTVAVLVSRDQYDEVTGDADVVVAYQGESVTLRRSEIYSMATTTEQEGQRQ